jgi:hypothetical protein
MPNLLLFPLKLLGWTAAGAALAVGWKLGSYLVDTVVNDPEWNEFFVRTPHEEGKSGEPLWQRKFSKVS